MASEGEQSAVTAPTPTITAVAHPGAITVTTHYWIHWLHAAIEQAQAARAARAEMEHRGNEGLPIAAPGRDPLGQEFRASMVAIGASAHALDALYGSPVVPPSARHHGQNRTARIREALKRVFATGPVNTPSVAQFDWLFDLRDDALHSSERAAGTVPHPVAGNTGPEHIDYSVESAERAVRFVLSVFRWCVDHPQAASKAWAVSMTPAIERLEHLWSNPGNT